MIHTRICDLLGIRHPIVLGGMGTATTAPLVAAVSNAGGFGTLGTSAFNAATLETEIASIRERTDKPFGVNHLLFQIQEDMFAITLRQAQLRRAFANLYVDCGELSLRDRQRPSLNSRQSKRRTDNRRTARAPNRRESPPMRRRVGGRRKPNRIFYRLVPIRNCAR